MIPLALLQAVGTRPRVHGNGFIQLDLTDRIRLHVWGDPRIPRQATETPIHDHAFGFTSYVLRGVLENKLYRHAALERDAEYQPHRAVVRHDEDTRLEPDGDTMWLWNYVSEFLSIGHSYAMAPGAVHETVAHGLAVSVIVKDGPVECQCPANDAWRCARATHQDGITCRCRCHRYVQEQALRDRGATVYVPIGVVPDNAFDRYAAPPELLWQIIAEALA